MVHHFVALDHLTESGLESADINRPFNRTPGGTLPGVIPGRQLVRNQRRS